MDIVSKRNFGVEIEFVHLKSESKSIRSDIRTKFQNWHVKSDRSIWPYGTEISSPILNGEEGLKEIEKVLEFLNSDERIKINSSCGLHVHVDVNDFTPEKVISTALRYSDYEEKFFNKVVDSKRNRSKYCRTTKDILSNTPMSLEDLSRLFNDMNSYKYNNRFDRYKKLNIHCGRFGTVEFRHHHATLNKDELINWVIFCANFVDATDLKLKSVDFDFASVFAEAKKAQEPLRNIHEVQNKLANIYYEKSLYFGRYGNFYHKMYDLFRSYALRAEVLTENASSFRSQGDFVVMKQTIEDTVPGVTINETHDTFATVFEIYYNGVPLRLHADILSKIAEESYKNCTKAITNMLHERVKDIDLFETIPESTVAYYKTILSIPKAKRIKTNKKIAKVTPRAA